MTSSTLRLAIPAVLLLSVAGCFSIGGGSDTTSTTSTVVQPTTGQQLIDLKRALDTGVITKEEYETLRQRIITPRP
jgi:hypothetical protein